MEGHPLGIIYLSNISSIKETKFTNEPFGFQINIEKREYQLAAGSKEELTKWITIINENLNKKVEMKEEPKKDVPKSKPKETKDIKDIKDLKDEKEKKVTETKGQKKQQKKQKKGGDIKN
eukprot:Anaeramoba_ignava/c15278_g1_i1.p1 GENE.c15278_g1_i1~~c15278_g1_i1.p1  ORF type:complete len:120 (+),score=46.31 c15278_g1_i1:591-950(+)